MAREIRQYAFTIPAGTAKVTPYTETIVFPPRIVVQIDWKVPPGPSGDVGWAIGSSGIPVIPRDANTWIVTDNESNSWILEDFHDSGSWELFGYNVGTYDHTIYFTFLCNLPSQGATSAPSAIPAGQISQPSTATVLVSSGGLVLPTATGSEGTVSTVLPAAPVAPTQTLPPAPVS